MELEKLKSDWKHAGTGKKNQNEILLMAKIKNHPKVKQIRIRFLIETIVIIAFLALYYDGFDGATKPIWVNIFLIGSTVAYILNRFIGWLVLRNPIEESNLTQSLKIFRNNLQRIFFFTLITSFLFGSSIILFFSVAIDFTKSKYMMFAGMIVFLVLLIFVSARNWLKKVRSIERTLEEFS